MLLPLSCQAGKRCRHGGGSSCPFGHRSCGSATVIANGSEAPLIHRAGRLRVLLTLMAQDEKDQEGHKCHAGDASNNAANDLLLLRRQLGAVVRLRRRCHAFSSR